MGNCIAFVESEHGWQADVYRAGGFVIHDLGVWGAISVTFTLSFMQYL